FVKGAPRTHHLHMLLLNGDAWRNHLSFRNYLRQNPKIAEEYDKLKKELAQKYKSDRDSYLDRKADFVERVLKMAQLSENQSKV
ncbi:MAG: GrpB family protein, partial [Actinomycetota bacterium]